MLRSQAGYICGPGEQYGLDGPCLLNQNLTCTFDPNNNVYYCECDDPALVNKNKHFIIIQNNAFII